MGKKITVRSKYRAKKPKKLEKLPKKRKLKKKKIYVKAKCQYHDEKKVRCTRNAIGSGQTCALHGGTKDLTNLLSPEATQLYLAGQGKVVRFNPAIHPLQMIDLSRQGLSDVEIAAELFVSVHTLRGWSETFEEFSVAYEIGQALHERWWLQKGKAGLDQRYFNTSLFKFLTGNKLGYADKVETKNLNMNTFGVLVAPAKQTMDEWEANGEAIDVESTEVKEGKDA